MINPLGETPGLRGLAQWLAQEAYTFKVGGSSPPSPTKTVLMKIDISDYYKEQGYDRVYVATNKEPRRVATLYGPNMKTASMSYAKYLYTSHYHSDVPQGYEVDHINSDKMDDRVKNLQIVTSKYNRQKDHLSKEMVVKICPVCGSEFLLNKRDEKFKPNPTCSRKCGNIKKSQTLTNRTKIDITKEQLEDLLKQNLSRKEAANILGVSQNTLRRYLKTFNLLEI